jgi:hypothetical protein
MGLGEFSGLRCFLLGALARLGGSLALPGNQHLLAAGGVRLLGSWFFKKIISVQLPFVSGAQRGL